MDRTGEALKNVPHSCHNIDVSWQKQYGKLSCDVPVVRILVRKYNSALTHASQAWKQWKGCRKFCTFQGEQSDQPHNVCICSLMLRVVQSSSTCWNMSGGCNQRIIQHLLYVCNSHFCCIYIVNVDLFGLLGML